MKRVFFIITILFITVTAFGQTTFRYGKCFNGYWDDTWENAHQDGFGYVLKGTYDEFVIYYYSSTAGRRPADYIAKVKIRGLNTNIDKKEKKRRKKANDWYKYTGTIEYYSNESNKTMEEWLRNFPRYVPAAHYSNVTKHTLPVRIWIAPYKKNPECYNIWLGSEMALGIRLL